MTDKDIIKALEVARYHLTASKHKDAIDNALDLINSLQEEIARLKKEAECFADIGKMYSEVKAEVRAEAVKEAFHKLRLRMGNCDLPNGIVRSHMEHIEKEMVGDSNV